MKYNEKDDVRNLFKELCNELLRIKDNRLDYSKRFVLPVYYPKQSLLKSINHEKMDAFNTTSNSTPNSLFAKTFKRTHQATLFTKWLVMQRRRELRNITRRIRVAMENEKRLLCSKMAT